MSNKFRKVLAAILAGTMVLGSGVVANAAEGSGEGKGSVDVANSEKVFNVILPTSAGTQFDYILDPTGVIAKTEAAKYGGTASASFVPDKTMYFHNAPASGSNIATYSDVSDPITAYNKSNFDVEISVKATIATPSGIELSNSSVATASTATPSMYIALKASGSEPKAITTSTGTVATSSIASASNCYVATYSDAKGYEYALATGSNLTATDSEIGTYFKSYSFMLTGDCNKAGKWIGFTETPPKVSLTWTIADTSGGGSYTDTTAHGSWSNGKLWLAKNASTGFSKTGLTVEVSDGGTTYKTLATDKYSINDAGWVSTTWNDIVAGIGSTPTGKAYVRITDGTTRYVFENK